MGEPSLLDSIPPAGSSVTLVSNGHELLAVPEQELARIERMNIDLPKCPQCGEEFEPRQSTGGKPQKFCSPECRKASHATAVPVPTSAPTSSPTPTVPPRPAPTSAWEPSPTPKQDDFDWSPEDEEDIVLAGQRRTAIYRNTWDQVCIRQERDWNEDDDPYLLFDVKNVPVLIERLAAELPDGHPIKRALAK